MSKYKSVINPDDCYFVTTSLVNRNFHFLNQKPYVQVILDSLEFLRKQQKMYLFAFVIMPNHLHLLNKPRIPYNISQVMHSFKRFTSQALKKILKEKDYSIWKQLEDFGGSVWQEGFLDENIFSEKLFLEKIEYIHNNPLAKGWQLVEERTDYKYSSACFYDKSEKLIIGIDNLYQVLMK